MASIRKRGNSWTVTISNGYDSIGKKIIKTKTFRKPHDMTDKKWEKEIEKLAMEFEKEVERGTYLDGGKISFKDFVNRWIHDYAEKNLAPKTLYRYKELLETRVIPALGHIKLDRIQPTQLLEFYNNLSEKGIRLDSKYMAKSELVAVIENDGLTIDALSESSGISSKTINGILKGASAARSTAIAISEALSVELDYIFSLKGNPQGLSERTILHHHRLISSILSCAVQWQLIFSNPADRVKPPKVERKQAKFYDEEDTAKLLGSLDKTPIKYKTAIHLVIFGGMRLGELSALTWDDIDFKNSLLQIKQATQYLPGEGSFIKETKNDTSDRIISMPQSVMELLKKYKAWQNEQRLKCDNLWYKSEEFPAGFVFTQWDGKPIFHDTISKWFSNFRKRNNLPALTFHQLRHTNASLLIGQGVNIQTVSKRLGHARASTTTDIYAHALKRPDKEAADKLETLFNKNGSELVKEA